MDLLQKTIAGIQVRNVALAFLIMLATLLLRWFFNRYFVRGAQRMARRTRHDFDDLFLKAVVPPISAFLFLTGLFLATRQLHIPSSSGRLNLWLLQSYKVSLSVLVVWVIFRLSDLVTQLLHRVLMRSDEEMAQQLTPLIRQALRWTVAILGSILIIQNLGYSVTSLLTGVGIGGLAVALAAQDTIANFFGTVVMFTDKPFKIGDWVKFKNVEGTVEEIGFRSTRVRTFANSVMVVPNKLIMSEIVENWSRMRKRRIKMTIGVTYDATPEQMENVVNALRAFLKGDSAVSQEFMLVNFTDFGDYSLNILLYFFTVTTDWARYMHERQRINLEIMRIVKAHGLEFAFPSQTLYFAGKMPLVSGDEPKPPQDPSSV